jgi:hypothetical protein
MTRLALSRINAQPGVLEMHSTEVQNITSAKNTHECAWCAEKILTGESYSKYRFYNGSEASTVKMHPECLRASEELMIIEKQAIEFSPGEHPRGCYCDHDVDCNHCKQN